MSDKKPSAPSNTDNSLSPSINWYENSKFCLIFWGINCFVNYELETWSRDLSTDFTLKDCLFGGVKLAKNADPDKYQYASYGIEFHSRSEFIFTDRSVGKNVIIFGVDMSSSVHIHNKNKDIRILAFGPTQGLNKITLTSEA